MLCAMEAGSAARSFKGSDCCARRARRGAGGRRVRADLCAQSVRAGADRSEQRAAFQQAAGWHDAFDPAGRDAVRRAPAPAKPASIPPARSQEAQGKRKPGSPYPHAARGRRQRFAARRSSRPGRPRRRRSLRARPTPTSTSRRMRRCAVRCRPTPIRTSRSACGSASSCCGLRSRSAMASTATRTARPAVRVEFTQVLPEVQIKSLWSRHELGATLRGSYYAYDNLPSVNRPAADTKVFGRYDFTRDLRFEGEGRFLLGTDNPGSPNLQADLAKLPIFTTWGATAGLAQRFNRLDLAVKGSVDRTDLPEFRADRRHQRQQRGPQLQSIPRARPRQLRIHARLQAVRRDRCRQAHPRQRATDTAAEFACSDAEGRRDVRIAALPDRRGFGRLYRRANMPARRCSR